MTARRRYASARDRRERRSKRILALTLLGVATFIGLVAWIWTLASKWNPVLDENLCAVDRPPTAEVLVVIDGTDEWNATQRIAVEQAFREVQSEVPRFGRVHLYAVAPTGDSIPEPVLQLCNPGQVDDFEDFPLVGRLGSRVVANPADLEDQWFGGYREILDDVMSRQGQGAARPVSPIMETLRAGAMRAFGESAPQVPRRLFVFSDLLQNAESYSVYSDAQWTGEDGRSLADLGRVGTSALRSVEVSVFLLDRELVGSSPGHSRSGLVELGDIFFSEQGALVMRIQRIEG